MKKIGFGELIKQKIDESEMSMRQIAESSGVNVGYISKIVNSNHIPSLKIATKLAEVLNISPKKMLQYYDMDYGYLPDFESDVFSSNENKAITKITKSLLDIKEDNTDYVSAITNILKLVSEFTVRYYLIDLSLHEETIAYEMPYIDENIKHLYCFVFNIDKYMIVKHIAEAPYSLTRYSVEDTLEKMDELDENDTEEFKNLKEILSKYNE